MGALVQLGGDHRARLDDLVDQPVVARLLRRHEAVAIDVLQHIPHGWRVWRAMISAIRRVIESTSRAWIWMSAGVPRAGRALVDHHLRVRERKALSGSATARIIAAADIPIPTQIVRTSGLTYCIAS